jgi:hypothetical protein
LVMRLSEADPESVRLGLQLTVETVRWQEQLRMDYTHTNIFGHLTRLDLTLVGGWAELPNPWAPEQHGPVARFTMLFTKKGLGEDLLLWTLRPSIELEIQEGYQFYSPTNRIGVSRWLGEKVSLGLSHNFRFVDFFNRSPSLDALETALGRDFADPFKLSSLDLQARVYLTNSISEPTDGVILSLDYAFSNKYLGSDYDFNQLTIGALALWKPAAWLQIAFRLKTGMILTYGTSWLAVQPQVLSRRLRRRSRLGLPAHCTTYRGVRRQRRKLRRNSDWWQHHAARKPRAAFPPGLEALPRGLCRHG